jgi:hypothetical protein
MSDTIKAYYAANLRGVNFGGTIAAPRIGVSGDTLQWVIPTTLAPAVKAHMAAAGITNLREMVKGDRTAIEARA